MIALAKLGEQPSTILVNVSREKVVHAGTVGLREGRLGGVTLDNFEGERSG